MPQTILIVEDEVIIAEDLALKVEELGYTVAGIATQGRAAIEMALRLRPQLILMDINLGGEIDGIEVAEAVRKHYDVPVIYLTAHSDPASFSRAKLTSPACYLLKPFEVRDLSMQIELALYKHQAKAALQASELRYRTLFMHSPDAIFVNLGERITMVNDACVRLFGAGGEEDLIGRSPWDFFRPDFHEVMRQRTSRMQQRGEPAESMEEEIIRLDGTTIDVAVTLSPFQMENDTAIHVILRDITERKKAQIALERSNRELDEFANAVSHDLQEPLRSVVGFLQLLQKRCGNQLDDTGKSYVERTVNAGRRMQSLINELLALARVSTRGGEFKTIDLNKIAREVLENLSSLIEQRTADISLTELPSLQGDAVQIRRLLQNLIVNALKYNTSAGPAVRIGCRSRDDSYEFFVQDNGIGIAPKFHGRVFKPFQRLHTDEEYSGTGMGLAICQKIVARHKGTIWVDSQPGEGSTFYFLLPKE